MATVAAGVGAIGAIGQVIGGQQAARAAGRAAQAQEAVARQQMQFARESRQEAMQLAEASPQELAQLESAIQQQERAVQRQSRLIDAVDPTLIESGKQALRLLRGEESAALQPLRDQRKRDRQQLIASLRETLGPGAEATAAGRQALREFDQQTSQQVFGAQQSTLGQLGQLQTSLLSARPNEFQGVQSSLGIAGAFGNISQRRAQAALGGAQGVQQAFGAQQQAAGSRFVESQIRGQALSSLGGALTQGAFTLAGGLGDSGLKNLSGGKGGQNVKAPTPFQTTANFNPNFGRLT